MQTRNELTVIFKQYPEISEQKVSELYEFLKLVDKGSAFEALSQLTKIAQEYKNNGFNKIDGKYSSEKGLSAKKSMIKMQKKLKNMIELVEDFSATDMFEFNNIFFLEMIHANNCIGVTSIEEDGYVMNFKSVLKTAHNITEVVINNQKNHTTDSTNTHRSIASKEIAEVIKNVMGKKISTTLETSLKPNSKPESALYCKILRLTLALVNDASTDYQKLMSVGIFLLNDKSLPKK